MNDNPWVKVTPDTQLNSWVEGRYICAGDKRVYCDHLGNWTSDCGHRVNQPIEWRHLTPVCDDEHKVECTLDEGDGLVFKVNQMDQDSDQTIMVSAFDPDGAKSVCEMNMQQVESLRDWLSEILEGRKYGV